MAIYVDSSALVKLAVREPESAALRRYIDLMRVNDRVLNAAAILPPLDMRSLDAIHLATALQLETDLKAIVTYDDRMAGAAKHAGLRVVQPR